MTQDTWLRLREDLRKRVGKDNFTTWIEPLVSAGLDGETARFLVPNTFFGDWVKRNYADMILHRLQDAGITAARLEFLQDPQLRADARASEPRANGHATGTALRPATRRRKPIASEDLPGAPPDPRFTFDSFVVGKPNALAHAAARRVAEGSGVTFNPLFLYGGVGLGKTHLMHAIANHLASRPGDLRVLYLSAEKFMYSFVQALREQTIMDFKELFRSVDVLMVDDLQFIAGKDSTQKEFFHTFNALVDQNKQIVLSADRAPGEIKDMEERIKSRLQCGLVVDLHPTDYELRLGILQQKMDQARRTNPSLVVAPGVLEFIAHRITSNVRVLEGAMTRLFAMAELVGREITLDLVQDSLADILRASDRKVSIDEIQRKVAEHYNVKLAELVGPKRHRTIARPRQVAMYLCKVLTTRSLPEIGRRFGGRDHTTILHGVKKVEELMSTDSQLNDDITMLRRVLQG
jgi:chromosomal replication initiator protein